MIAAPRLLRCLGALGLAAFTVAGPSASAVAATPLDRLGRPSRIVLVAIPNLGFDDVAPSAMPTLTRLADRGATAALSVKTIGRHTNRAGAYATLGAGARAVAPNTPETSGRGADELLPAATSSGSAIVVPDLGAVTGANHGQHQGADIGALGRLLHAHGWTTAIVANHDGARELDRVAALAVVRPSGHDESGIVDAGSVAPSLTTVGPGQQRRSDGQALADAASTLSSNRAVVVVEIGDLVWAEQEGASPTQRRAAAMTADKALEEVAARLTPSDLLIVLAPTAPGHQEQPTPFVMVGPGVDRGTATSATTRRSGNVTLPDVSATILDRSGVSVPASMTGTPITVASTTSSGVHRLADLRAEIREIRFVDRSAGIFLVTLPIVFACWALLTLLAIVVPLGNAEHRARDLVRWFGLGIASAPIVTYLVGGFTVGTWGQPLWSGLVWGVAAAAGIGVWVIRPPARGVVALSTVIWTVLVVDVVLGGSLQFATPLGNSPTVAGRFAGIGNNAFGLLGASTLVLAVAAWQQAADRWTPRVALVAAGAVFAVAILVDGLPSLGSDVGGVLTLSPVAAMTLWSLSGRRLSWPRLLAAGLGTISLLGIFTVIDLLRPESSQTHLGRLARGIFQGDGSGEVIRRKFAASLDSFVDSSLVWIVICTLLLVGLVWVLQREFLTGAMTRPHAPTLVAGAVALSILGTALNDSGVMVAAMMATVFVPGAVHLLLGSTGEGA